MKGHDPLQSPDLSPREDRPYSIIANERGNDSPSLLPKGPQPFTQGHWGKENTRIYLETLHAECVYTES